MQSAKRQAIGGSVLPDQSNKRDRAYRFLPGPQRLPAATIMILLCKNYVKVNFHPKKAK